MSIPRAPMSSIPGESNPLRGIDDLSRPTPSVSKQGFFPARIPEDGTDNLDGCLSAICRDALRRALGEINHPHDTWMNKLPATCRDALLEARGEQIHPDMAWAGRVDGGRGGEG